MGWSIGYDDKWKRWIGYGVPATCDHPKCDETIDRGLAHVCCGQEPYGGENGCGLYFCEEHLRHWRGDDHMCARCARRKPPFTPKPETRQWLIHLRTAPSWAEWRNENPAELKNVIAQLAAYRQSTQGGKNESAV